MGSLQTKSFLFLELPRELQRKVLEHYYDAPFEIYLDHHRDDRDRRILKFTTNLEAEPLRVCRTFRHDALSILYATRNNSLFWWASGTRIHELLISDHFLHLCATVSTLELWERYDLENLRNFRTRLPNLSLIKLRPFGGTGSSHNARIVIESASSILPVLQGDLDERFKNAAIEDLKSWLMPESSWMPYMNPNDLENLAFGLPIQFRVVDIWPAEDQKLGFPGSLLVCLSRIYNFGADVSQTFHIEVNLHECHIRKKHFTRFVNYYAQQQDLGALSPTSLRADQEEEFRRAISIFSGVELSTTEEEIVYSGDMSPVSLCFDRD